MLPQQYCLRWKYHHSNLQTMFSQLLDRGCFCDVTLACEGQLIRAHRVVLCACSSFFDTVLTNYASERDPIIIMKDVTFADVKCLIEFMYKGEINVEHANLASLLKTADDLKIKGLAEVSWRDDEDGPPLPNAATEFHSPTPTQGHDMYNTRPEQQRVGSPSFMPPQRLPRERKLSSPKDTAHAQQGLPTLTPLPPTSSASMVAVAAAAAAAAAVASAASPVESYLGPKRKRGRPPLDDAYDVFNVRKLAQYGSHLDAHHHHQAYLEAQRQYNDEQRRLAVISPIPAPSSTSVAAAAAYHQHIQQQQHNKRMRQLHRQQQQQQQLHQHQLHVDADELEHEDAQADPEWITSNLEVNVGGGGDNEPAIECDADIAAMKEQKMEIADDKEAHRTAKIEARKRKERHSEEREKLNARERSLTRKRSSAEEREDNNSINDEREREERESREHSVQNELSDQTQERKGGNVDGEEEEKVKAAASVPQPVEEMENVRQSKDKLSNASANTTTTATSGAHKRGNITSEQSATLPLPPPPSLHHPAHAYGKYAPEGYLLNEHGILMTHDFVHAPTAPIPSTGATASSSSGAVVGVAGAANGNDQDYVDIKMEEYDGTDLRLTTEEISEWQDVIKMDDYLAKGRRPQFWEEPFTRRVLDAIKNKRLEMKKAARILGVSYGTLYGRYREVYGCLKHPYSSSTFRPTQSNQLAVQPRFDMVWPSPKRDSGLMPGQLEIGKIRPKDLSELWTRPQI
nr:longitudinals lacking protein, isoforms J/P/Q/S/Z isoform X1 [Bactrocera oleae]XP_036222493.1 longitudinals lacking protein, isoforms J/P/Q/S/Z isoform X1 [Bactrocera oleae]XP_036222494.1 longitudinals lacking protein, isoforms J/P/Q/S/Z isoform X1 [Bactrocera oleae]XP_036222495.1 longitudinals lacking protein, isoforms J/P/Q/S/Z isoform X1 [Bactrocera oleae]XP_036222496.1 longitudinals lacking protein, isoforms J/P/Q/S/Z isoform X1 [Bactrocera oleae]XP_036222497.1 longitudinals lacking pro